MFFIHDQSEVHNIGVKFVQVSIYKEQNPLLDFLVLASCLSPSNGQDVMQAPKTQAPESGLLN